ncbi:uncharacterized protein LOC134839088 isoform X2 [Symsagittifera roscoffensis]|uniref:uncharacterized protein LOC134839088 isoform X2 n=1 Tax=Symsagittifera roscoffensis TaxID=84072 RepID=UPI00307CC749
MEKVHSDAHRHMVTTRSSWVEEWLLKSHSSEEPNNLHAHNRDKDNQLVAPRIPRRPKWPSVFTQSHLDGEVKEQVITDGNQWRQGSVVDNTVLDSFEKWKQNVARKKDFARQIDQSSRQLAEQQVKLESDIVSYELRPNAHQEGSANDFEKWQDAVKHAKKPSLKSFQEVNSQETLPRIETAHILTHNLDEVKNNLKPAPEFLSQRSRKFKTTKDDDNEQKYYDWIFQTNRARKVLFRQADIVNEMPKRTIETANQKVEAAVFEREYVDNSDDVIDFGLPERRKHSPVPGLEVAHGLTSLEQQSIYESFVRMKIVEERSKRAKIMRLGAKYETKTSNELTAEELKPRNRTITFGGETDGSNRIPRAIGSKKLEGIQNLREIQILDPFLVESYDQPTMQRASKNVSQFPVASENLNDPNFSRPKRRNYRDDSSRSEFAIFSDGVLLPEDLKLNLTP